jgi:polysaccharide biosynthesis protein PelF
MKRLRVCIVLEGSYPFITGGVSAWVQDLISGLPEIDFALFTISPEEEQEPRYDLPKNVVEHKDIVVWKRYVSTRKPKDIDGVMAALHAFHREVTRGGSPANVLDILRQLPEGYFLYEDAVTHDKGWDLITEANDKQNPLYPFTDYFWAWNSAHSMMFTVLGASPPEADLYHSVSTGFAGIAALGAKARRGKPFLLTEHGLYHKEREMEIRKAKFVRGYQRDMWINLYANLSRLCYGNADTVTSLFEENRQKQLELGAYERNTVVIPNGIDVERYTVRREEREGFHIGLVGRVVPIKDIKTYIATAKIVSTAIPEAKFYCIGPVDEDPAYYEDCNLMVSSLKLSEVFTFTGRQNVLDYYAFLDVMLLTSIREAQPLVILEAYQAGIPFVGTRVGNVAELLNYDSRFIAPLKDAEKLAEGIIYIYKNREEIAELTKKNKERVTKFYNKQDLIRKYLDLYRQTAGAAAWRA